MRHARPAVLFAATLLAAAPALAQDAPTTQPADAPSTRPAESLTDRERAMVQDLRQMSAGIEPMFRQMGALLQEDDQPEAAAAATGIADRIAEAIVAGTVEKPEAGRVPPPAQIEAMAKQAVDEPARVKRQMRQLAEDLPPMAEKLRAEDEAMATFMTDLAEHAQAFLDATPHVDDMPSIDEAVDEIQEVEDAQDAEAAE